MLREMNHHEITLVNGGLHLRLDLGQTLAAIALGAVTGGPVGVGYALSVIVMAQGVNKLNQMQDKPPMPSTFGLEPPAAYDGLW